MRTICEDGLEAMPQLTNSELECIHREAARVLRERQKTYPRWLRDWLLQTRRQLDEAAIIDFVRRELAGLGAAQIKKALSQIGRAYGLEINCRDPRLRATKLTSRVAARLIAHGDRYDLSSIASGAPPRQPK